MIRFLRKGLLKTYFRERYFFIINIIIKNRAYKSFRSFKINN